MPLLKERFPNFSLDSYLKQQKVYFRKHDSEDHTEYATNCPECKKRGEARPDTKKRLWINPKKGTFYCYNCGWDGPLTRLVQTFSKCDWRRAIKILEGDRPSSLELLNFELIHEEFDFNDEKEKLREIEFPHGFQLFADFACETDTIYHDYLDSRGVPLEIAIAHGWGFSDVGFVKHRIVVPHYVNERLVFWQARDVLEDDHPDYGTKDYKKVLNPKGCSARSVLYNYDVAKLHGEIILCEGFIDAIKAGPNAVATNGKVLHAAQVELLTNTNAKSIIILWDDDAYTDEKIYTKGRFKGKIKKPSSAKAAQSALQSFFKVRFVRLPAGRDAGSYEMGELESVIMEPYRDASPFERS